jgi:hypothetical protein
MTRNHVAIAVRCVRVVGIRVALAAALWMLVASPAYAGSERHGASGHKRCDGVIAAREGATPETVKIGANWTLTTAAGAPAVVAPTLEQVRGRGVRDQQQLRSARRLRQAPEEVEEGGWLAA